MKLDEIAYAAVWKNKPDVDEIVSTPEEWLIMPERCYIEKALRLYYGGEPGIEIVRVRIVRADDSPASIAEPGPEEKPCPST